MTTGTAESVSLKSSMPLLDYYRCVDIPSFGLSTPLSERSGFFRFGQDLICYGRTVAETRSVVDSRLLDVYSHLRIENDKVLVPFDMTEVVDNLRYEAYAQSSNHFLEKSWIKDIYYRLRPMFPVGSRKHLQK